MFTGVLGARLGLAVDLSVRAGKVDLWSGDGGGLELGGIEHFSGEERVDSDCMRDGDSQRTGTE